MDWLEHLVFAGLAAFMVVVTLLSLWRDVQSADANRGTDEGSQQNSHPRPQTREVADQAESMCSLVLTGHGVDVARIPDQRKVKPWS
ncbi:hypothetical protein [Kineococcus rubinsiae]|uniref:hypothetical protein n=1 Tax=Kineococcus rubinsiae TaxID=2609562 RepID=UPI0014320089|nr:hypothetical protein [Kineococcus rubinsiae]NIZ90350.1 hypothetical protein [Kineococcus rubinsiae]